MEERIPNKIDENILKFSEQISDSYAEFVVIRPAEKCNIEDALKMLQSILKEMAEVEYLVGNSLGQEICI